MKILVTNDDSINSKGLFALAKSASKYGDVFVIAPKHEQSAKSHGIDIVNGLILEEYENDLNFEAYQLSSTPADCVRAGVFALEKEFEIVFSGINNGLNIGEDIAYSGTVAAVSEACMLGKKGIAFSSNVNSYQDVIENFDKIMAYFKKHELLKYHNLYNVNVPNNPKGIMITKQGSTHFDTRFDNINGMYYQMGEPRHKLDKNNVDSDVYAIYHNYISITPLINDRTNYEVFKRLQNKS